MMKFYAVIIIKQGMPFFNDFYLISDFWILEKATK